MNERIRARLEAGEPAYGLWVTLPTASVTELAAALGLDWVCVDLEHGALDLGDVLDHLSAARGSGLSCFVRLPTARSELLGRVLDSGADGILLPLVRSAGEVREAVDRCLFPPRGRRGIGGERSMRWGFDLSRYLETANEQLLVVPMIETAEAVDAIDEIVAVPGVSAVFFGPADLSASAGYVGHWEAPGVADAIARVRRSAAAQGKPSGIVALGAEDALRRRDDGFELIAIGTDAALLIRQAQQTLSVLDRPAATQSWA